jgi:hypothetical protein
VGEEKGVGISVSITGVNVGLGVRVGKALPGFEPELQAISTAALSSATTVRRLECDQTPKAVFIMSFVDLSTAD